MPVPRTTAMTMELCLLFSRFGNGFPDFFQNSLFYLLAQKSKVVVFMLILSFFSIKVAFLS